MIILPVACDALPLPMGWLSVGAVVAAGSGIVFMRFSSVRLKKKQKALLDQHRFVCRRKKEETLRHEEAGKKRQTLRQEQDKLAELHHTKTLLFQTISGDVQHPLIRLKTKLEGLVEKKIDETQFKKEVTELTQTVGNLSQLLENLLQWSKYQAQRQAPVSCLNEWQSLVETAICEVKFGADKKQIALENPPTPGVTIFADRDMIKTVLKALLQNAINVMEKGNSIVCLAAGHDDMTEIRVTLYGKFLLKHLFVEKFSDESYGNFQPETGRSVSLGWMYCKAVVAENKGTIHIAENMENSVAIIMQFPSK